MPGRPGKPGKPGLSPPSIPPSSNLRLSAYTSNLMVIFSAYFFLIFNQNHRVIKIVSYFFSKMNQLNSEPQIILTFSLTNSKSNIQERKLLLYQG